MLSYIPKCSGIIIVQNFTKAKCNCTAFWSENQQANLHSMSPVTQSAKEIEQRLCMIKVKIIRFKSVKSFWLHWILQVLKEYHAESPFRIEWSNPKKTNKKQKRNR